MSRLAEIQAKIAATEAEIAGAVEAGDKERAVKLGGMVDAYRSEYQDEAAVVEAENMALKAKANVPNRRPTTFAEKLLGPRDEFTGIEVGWRSTVDAATTLPLPSQEDLTLPGAVRPVIGFLDTLPKGIANGSMSYFKQPSFTNNAATWSSGSKAESAVSWTQATALPEIVAHWIPVARQIANRYDELDGATRRILLLGLEAKKNQLALRGSNSEGIVGAVNQTGILTHSRRTSDTTINLRDEIMTMARKVRVASGFSATHVALSPYAIELIMQAKDDIGNYVFPDFEGAGDTICGLKVVEDVNMTYDASQTDTPSIKESALVYFNGAAEWDVLDADEVTVGLTDKQFIQNAYTLLAEGTYLLQCPIPAGFCYCGDLAITPEA